MRVGLRGRLVRSRVKSTLLFLSVLLTGIPFLSIAVHSQGPAQDVTCENGGGEYSTQFFTGTTVSVGPMRNGSFAERGCAAKLVWKGQEISAASDADQVGIDVLGADLGFGKPVVAFLIDKSGGSSKRIYKI